MSEMSSDTMTCDLCLSPMKQGYIIDKEICSGCFESGTNPFGGVEFVVPQGNLVTEAELLEWVDDYSIGSIGGFKPSELVRELLQHFEIRRRDA